MKILIRTLFLAVALLPALMLQAATLADKIRDLPAKSGLFDLYWSAGDGQLLLAIDRFEQPFIYLTSLPQGIGSNDIGLDRGQLGESRLVQFERFGHRVLLRQLNAGYRAESDNASERAAMTQAFAESVLWSGEIQAQDGDRVLVDVSSLVMTDLHGIGDTLAAMDEGSYQVAADKSAVDWSRTKSFPRNTELTATITLTGKPEGQYLAQVTPDPRFVSLAFRHSLVALPEPGYQPRAFHPDSGYFGFEYQDYSQPIGSDTTRRFVNRHRLSLDAAGKVLEPIVYYLDPGAPEPVRSALLDGARWWSEAFAAAGFEGGFQVKMLPADADPLDVRYNVIQWVHRATRGWSYGAAVIDPRNGEIIKGHVTLGSLRVRQDYLIAMGLLAAKDREQAHAEATAMALARIRQLSAHEVGHTLGLAHNFAGSVNNRASVMDYPHPLITLDDEQQIDLSQAYGVGVGAWDRLAIRYGYQAFVGDEQAQLAAWVAETQQQGLLFLSDPDSRADDTASQDGHLWDNGREAEDELRRLTAVRQVALQGFGARLLAEGTPQSELREALVPVYLLHRFQVAAAAKLIGGVDYNYGVQGGAVRHQPVTPARQREALAAILTTLTPDFLTLPPALLAQLPPRAYGYRDSRESFGSGLGGLADPLIMAEAAARHSLDLMLSPVRLNRLLQQAALMPTQPGVTEVITAVNRTVFEQPQPPGLAGLVLKRVQAVVVDQWLTLLRSPQLAPESAAEIGHQLALLHKQLKSQGKQRSNQWRPHFQWLADGLARGREDGSSLLLPTPAVLPPGSPI